MKVLCANCGTVQANDTARYCGRCGQPMLRYRPVDARRLTDHELIHLLWTKAVGTSDYSKAEWNELARRFDRDLKQRTTYKEQ